MKPMSAKKRQRRTQISIIVGCLVILLAGWYLEDYMHHAAQARAAEHKHTFYEYVVTHNLGNLVLIDTGTGIDPMAYVLKLSKPVPDAERVSFSKNLAHLYAQYDEGANLSILYIDPNTHRQVPVAESNWSDDSGQLQLTVTFSDGHTEQLNEHVSW